MSPEHLPNPMSTDPRIEAAAAALLTFETTTLPLDEVPGPRAREMRRKATAALAAADKAATITTVEGLDALPVGSVILSDTYQYSLTTPNYPVSFQKLYGGLWYRGGRSSNTHESYILPARVIHWGTE